ncbi:MAG: DUF2231 domain-containing protein [Gammaproteobacteria bacterium]|nr:DUF2231 domain-containing protein [Gammaproteobacteria bacterium]
MEIIPNWHPIFVHFTVAMLTVSVGLYVMCVFMKEGQLKTQCRVVARWNLWIGSAVTVLTILTGWYAYNTVVHDEPSHLAMTNHRNWALVTATVFFLLTVWSIWLYRKKVIVNHALTAGLVIALILLGATAWHGGEVVYRYGLGVMSLPQVETTGGDGHAHSHGEENTQEKHEVEAMDVKVKPPNIPHGEAGHSH